MSVIQTQNLKRLYQDGDNIIHAVDGVNLKVEAGEFAALVGPSGSGKTTLLNLIGGLDTPSEGSVIVDQKPIQHVHL